MKKKLLIIGGCAIGAVLLVILLAPSVILAIDKQEKVADEYAYSDVFFNEYEEVRNHLLERVENLKEDGLDITLHSYELQAEEGLYIDSVYIPAKDEQKNLIVLTTGVHGIEGYIGSVMLDVFLDEVYPELDGDNTGILIVANVNPYGMKYHRRYNENNVDLNRNFIPDWNDFDKTVNKDYPKCDEFLGPKSTMGNILFHEVGFYGQLLGQVVTNGADTISNALLGGQYEYAEGVYYGGDGDEESTAFLKDVFKQTLNGAYENIVHIDIHSGYGQRYKMVIFNSESDRTTEEDAMKLYNYDNVIAWDSEDFYPTTGDTTYFYYELLKQMKTEVELYSTCFEFGTIGDGFVDSIISMKYTIEEKQNHLNPSSNRITNQIIHERYQELFYPTEKKWREKTIEDFKQACKGVLDAKLMD